MAARKGSEGKWEWMLSWALQHLAALSTLPLLRTQHSAALHGPTHLKRGGSCSITKEALAPSNPLPSVMQMSLRQVHGSQPRPNKECPVVMFMTRDLEIPLQAFLSFTRVLQRERENIYT